MKDLYLYLSLVKDNVNHFVSSYYNVLNGIIGAKSKSYQKEEKYNTKFNLGQLIKDMTVNNQLLEKASKTLTKGFSDLSDFIGENFEMHDDGDDDDEVEAKNHEGYLEYNSEEDNGKFKKGFFKSEKEEKEKYIENPKNLDEKAKNIKAYMNNHHISLESELSFQFKSWTEIYFSLKTGLHKEFEKEFHFGYQQPFYFPAFPVLQLRFGIQFKVYIKLTIGVDIELYRNQKEGFGADVRGFAEFVVGAKLDVLAEAGIYGGVAEFAGGVSGSLLDARVGVKIVLSIAKLYLDFNAFLTINAFQFRVYVEARVKILFWKGTIKIYEDTFGLKKPLLEATFYIRFNFAYAEIEEPKKNCESIFKG